MRSVRVRVHGVTERPMNPRCVRRRGVYASLTLLCATGCTGGEEPRGFSTADSLGVEIATNDHTPAALPLRILNEVPEREISGDELYEITAIQPLTTGELAVGATGSGFVMIYDRSGTPKMTVGRAGEGPGEFRRISTVVPWPADSIGVYDAGLQRLSVFSLRGDLGRVLSLSDLAPDGGNSRVLPLEEGLVFVGESALARRQEEGVYRNAEPSYRIDLEGNVLATYGDFPGMEAFFGIGMMGRAPFGAALWTATSSDQFIVGPAEEPELQFFGPDGSVTRIIRWLDGDRTVTQDRMNEYLEFLLAQSTAEEAAFLRDRVSGMPFASRRPAHAEVIAGPDMELWVGEYAGPEADFPGKRGPSRRWMIFDTNGAMRDRVQTPEGFVPYALTEELVWGVYRDTLDVESVRAYRISEK